jgi:acyl carrier protein
MTDKIQASIESFVRSRFQVRPDDGHFSVDVNLWEEGYVDSAGVVEMIAFLEQTFTITLAEEVLFDPDFTHIRGICRLVSRASVSSPTQAA